MVIQLLQRKNSFLDNISVVILCAGEGTRLKDITKDIPKPLLKIKSLNDLSILHHAINNLDKLGMKRIAIVKGHLGHKIDEFISSITEKNAILKEKIHLIDSGNKYKLGPLYSFLSITRSKSFLKENSVYIVIPGDTIFQLNLLRRILNIITNQVDTLKKNPVVFYRKIDVIKLKECQREINQNESNCLSIVEVVKVNKNIHLKLIKRQELRLLPESEKIYQIIPLFVFPHNFFSEIVDLEKLGAINTITGAINLAIKNRREILAIEIESNLNFYDFDDAIDYNNFKKEKKPPFL